MNALFLSGDLVGHSFRRTASRKCAVNISRARREIGTKGKCRIRFAAISGVSHVAFHTRSCQSWLRLENEKCWPENRQNYYQLLFGWKYLWDVYCPTFPVTLKGEYSGRSVHSQSHAGCGVVEVERVNSIYTQLFKWGTLIGWGQPLQSFCCGGCSIYPT